MTADCTPNSVCFAFRHYIEDHLSVADHLCCAFRPDGLSPALFVLASEGACRAPALFIACGRCALTAPFHPCRPRGRRCFFCCAFRKTGISPRSPGLWPPSSHFSGTVRRFCAGILPLKFGSSSLRIREERPSVRCHKSVQPYTFSFR